MRIENIWVFLLLFAFIIVLVVGQKSLRDLYLTKMTKSLTEKDYEQFNKYLDKFFVKLLFDPFNLCYMRLNAAFNEDDKDKIGKALREFDFIDLSPKQKEDVYSRGFNYYMYIKDFEKAHVFVEKFNQELGSLPASKQTQVIYDIYAENSGKHLDELLQQLKDTPMSQRGFVEMLVSDSYKNLNDDKNAKKYKDLSLSHFKALENEIRKENKHGKAGSAKR